MAISTTGDSAEAMWPAFLEALRLLINKSQNSLEAAKSTVDALQTLLQDSQATRQQQIETLLATIGAAFALTQILDRDFTSAILHVFGYPTSPEHDVFLLGCVQIAMILALTWLIWRGITWWLGRGRAR